MGGHTGRLAAVAAAVEGGVGEAPPAGAELAVVVPRADARAATPVLDGAVVVPDAFCGRRRQQQRGQEDGEEAQRHGAAGRRVDGQ